VPAPLWAPIFASRLINNHSSVLTLVFHTRNLPIMQQK
jgi:hypothetical protein